ncbi:AMP-binding protein [Actinomadura kijaniata]|uniref:Fatty-acyl-CoA synthase n=1 Tax=Actinomadura namibiensis TaxID=182080 RepID=A0A7W3QR67_ACTNM|nr:long-chain-fatty-acid--CoA ligase [Actinomadura namibiensis]MBA8956444.1 fatty-acyl-CoA synthase [Actinomadura namibiensis]
MLSPLSPLAFLKRSAEVFPGKPAVVHGDRRWTYADLAERVTRLAGALRASGVGPGDRVAYLAPNIPELLVAHFAVPLAGAVLVAINTRLSPEEVRHICDHSRARLLVVDAGLHATVAPLAGRLATVTEIVTVAAPDAAPGPDVGGTDYETFAARGGDTAFPWEPADENAPISVNYTSGTTGRPKGVVYTHRGAYLNALGEIVHSRHTPDSVYLWTLPMFHCNGWCTPWALVAAGGTQVCLRAVDGERIWELVDSEGVTHLNGAPPVLRAIADASRAHRLDRPLVITTAAAPPSPTTMARLEELGARIVHVYGLTETYGPYAVCEPQPGWEGLPAADRARMLARQGVGMLQTDGLRVVDEEMNDVPADGATLGEIVMRGNNVMAGYLDDEAATAHAFRGGWFHSGDLGVRHPDGYVELRDRAKDIIISGGENISTVEVESAIDAHPAVREVAVVAVPDDRWGERPKAFVVPRDGHAPTEAEIIAHVRDRLAHFKAPDRVEFVPELPRTSTGKIQKFQLREKEWAGRERRIQG